MTKRKFKRAERDEVLDLVDQRGIRVAIQAAIDVCEDKNAPAPARATAAGLLMRAGAIGGFAKKYAPPEQPGPLDHLSEDDRQAAYQRHFRWIEEEIAEIEPELLADDDEPADEDEEVSEPETGRTAPVVTSQATPSSKKLL